jgi:hypothetical protein
LAIFITKKGGEKEVGRGKRARKFVFKTDNGWRIRIVLWNKFMFYLAIAKGADFSSFQ